MESPVQVKRAVLEQERQPHFFLMTHIRQKKLAAGRVETGRLKAHQAEILIRPFRIGILEAIRVAMQRVGVHHIRPANAT